MEASTLKTRVLVTSEDGTVALAQAIAPLLEGGDVVALVGPLGAGKTFFTRALARALGVPPEVPVRSPSFMVLDVYQGRLPIIHFDLYRLSEADELEAVGWRDWLGEGGVCVVEWADRIPESMPESMLVVSLWPTAPEVRSVEVTACAWSDDRCRRLEAALSGMASDGA